MKRVFVAVDISDEARKKVAAYVEGLRGYLGSRAASWVRPEKLHLTLHFVGDCDDDELRRLTELVGKCAAKTRLFDIAIEGTGVFPNSRRARILWLGIRDDGKHLNFIQSNLEPQTGPSDNQKPFRPHLTIARIKDARASREVVAKHLANTFEPVEFGVSEIVIYESTLTRDGSVYSVLSTYQLKGTS